MTTPEVVGANRAFLVEGDPGGDDGEMLEGLTSTMTGVTVCLPREEGIVATAALRWLTKRGNDDSSVGGNVSVYSTYSNANDGKAQ